MEEYNRKMGNKENTKIFMTNSQDEYLNGVIFKVTLKVHSESLF